MEEVDITIIGAGVVGLSIASQVAKKNRDVILVERHGGFGEETSSRHSEVIHAGIYYSPGSLKAKLCLEGNRLLYRICEKNGIPCNPIGKLMVAINEVEENGLEDLVENGRRNGVSGLRIISSREVQKLEPHIKARAAIFSPSSGILDSHRLMKYFETTAKNNNASIVYGCEVKTIERTPKGYQVGTQDTDGEPFSFLTRILINSAGLCSDKIAEMVGIDVVKSGYRLYYSKGEYVRVGGGKAKLVKRLVYPTPKETSLGIHTVTDLQGELKLGPNAFYVDDINYDIDPEHVAEFYESVKPFLPFIEKEDLTPDMSGIRPKLQASGEPVKDFIIVQEEEKGLPGLINLIGIDSPGLTASPAIGRLVESMVERIL